MLESDVSPAEILRLVSDISAGGNFLARVMVVEIDKTGPDTRIKALPVQQWGEYIIPEGRKKPVFQPDIGRAVGAPFVIPKGGNPLHPQGCYGVPAYPAYDRHVRSMIDSPEAAEDYLNGRVDATLGLELSDAEIEMAAVRLHEAAGGIPTDKKEKLLGIVILAVTEKNGLYSVLDEIPVGNPKRAYIGPSMLHKGKHLAARLDRIQQRFWRAKLVEGAEMGKLEGGGASCFFCTDEGRVVSSYCKAWPWFTTTWTCPLPAALEKDELVEGIALCARCYAALVLGANLFHKLTKRLDNWLTKTLSLLEPYCAG